MPKSRDAEIREAITAANEALDHLRAADDELDSARKWGLFDLFLGNVLTSVVKHGRLGTAQSEIDAAKASLRRFSRELRDVDEDAGLNVEVGGFLEFCDIFLDNVIADWFVQDRIEEARRQVAEAIRQVEYARDQLCRLR